MNYRLIEEALIKETEEDFSSEDCEYLFERYNIKFSEVRDSYVCFRGSNVGGSGLAETKVRAFTRMLKALGFERDLKLSVEESLKAFFDVPP